jgi:hypothetical protein
MQMDGRAALTERNWCVKGIVLVNTFEIEVAEIYWVRMEIPLLFSISAVALRISIF